MNNSTKGLLRTRYGFNGTGTLYPDNCEEVEYGIWRAALAGRGNDYGGGGACGGRYSRTARRAY